LSAAAVFLEKAKAAGADLRAEGGKLYGRNLPLELQAELKGTALSSSHF
jgi:hypothetical protein